MSSDKILKHYLCQNSLLPCFRGMTLIYISNNLVSFDLLIKTVLYDTFFMKNASYNTVFIKHLYYKRLNTLSIRVA